MFRSLSNSPLGFACCARQLCRRGSSNQSLKYSLRLQRPNLFQDMHGTQGTQSFYWEGPGRVAIRKNSFDPLSFL
jgi:hypothetical protein